MAKLTTIEAAEIAGVDIRTIRRWCEHNKVKSERFGTAWQVDEDSLRAHKKDIRGRKRQESD